MEKNKSLDQVVEFEGEWKGGFSVEDNGYDDGKFNMTINQRSDGTFSGTTNDKHGVANVNGEMKNNHIKFMKKYITNQSSSDALKAGIIYEGEKVNDGAFKGFWYPEWAHDIQLRYEFTLNKKPAGH